MDSALKQRLLGAVVLIALAIIVVPILFSGSGPKQESATVNLEIPPAPNREFETRVLAVDAASRDPGLTPVPAPQAGPVVTVDTEALPRVEERSPEPKPAVTSPPVAPPAAAVKPPTPAQLVAGEGASGKFLVHLGVYSSAKNAEDLVATLKRGGFAAFAESVDFQGKSAQRVRVGPYGDRAEAEAARIRIKQIKPDVPGSVIALAENANADAPVAAVPATRAGGWAVQIGALKTAEDANKLRGRLQGAGFVAYVDKLAAEGQTLWRVRVGPEVERVNADKLRERIKEKLKLDGMIVSQP